MLRALPCLLFALSIIPFAEARSNGGPISLTEAELNHNIELVKKCGGKEADQIDAGADIYIEKSAGAQEIGNALRALMTTDGSFEELAPTDNKLSKRQKQLIVMLDRGLSNREIADELGISEHTVKVHLWRLFRRLGVKSRTQALHHARSHGLLSTGPT